MLVLVLTISTKLSGGSGPPEMKARQHFPVICIRNERQCRRTLRARSLLLLHVSRYSFPRRFVAHPVLDFHLTNDERTLTLLRTAKRPRRTGIHQNAFGILSKARYVASQRVGFRYLNVTDATRKSISSLMNGHIF